MKCSCYRGFRRVVFESMCRSVNVGLAYAHTSILSKAPKFLLRHGSIFHHYNFRSSLTTNIAFYSSYWQLFSCKLWCTTVFRSRRSSRTSATTLKVLIRSPPLQGHARLSRRFLLMHFGGHNGLLGWFWRHCLAMPGVKPAAFRPWWATLDV